MHRPVRRGHHGRSGLARPPCKFFAEGRCTKGEACNFLHDFEFTPEEDFDIFADSLVVALQKAGGKLSSGQLGSVYKQSPGLQGAVQSVGGLKEFCAKFSELAFDHGNVMYVPDEIEVSALPEDILEMQYPEHVESIIVRIKAVISSINGASLHAFGSSVSGFGDAGSDIDLVLLAPAMQLKQSLGLKSRSNVVKQALVELQTLLSNDGIVVCEAILGAKVPILRLVCHGFECDLSINNSLALFNTCLLKAYAAMNPLAVKLLHIVKQWAKEQQVHGAAEGNLSTYAFTLMVIFYMQVRDSLPCLQEGLAPQWWCESGREYNVAMSLKQQDPRNRKSLGFHDFASFYSNELDWGSSVVSVRTGRLESVSAYPTLREKNATFHIEDPFDVERNLAGALTLDDCKMLRRALVSAARSPT